ncbi:MAG: methionyl-tRNA formyltransferase [Deltaproteobacteria bacterium]|nr:methionyl-tRNA formyltransferase [Deltaproteobacteria bacterium]
MNILFMGSPAIAQTILANLCAQYIPVAVVTQRAKPFGRGRHIQPTPVEQYAKTNSLDVLAVDNVNDPKVIKQLKQYNLDLILVAAFGQILKQELLQLPRHFCLNVHASLLPQYRGAAPIQWAIWNGDKVTGITIQKMTRKLDAGDILLKKELAIRPDDTSETLTEHLACLGGKCLIEAVKLVETGHPSFTSQKEELATYARKIERSDAPIDWNNPADRILNQIRALVPWPVAETNLKKDPLKIFRAEKRAGFANSPPGTLHTDSRSFLAFQCGDEMALCLLEVQQANRKKLPITEFLRGYR